MKKVPSHINKDAIYSCYTHNNTIEAYMITNILPLGGRISYIIGERRYSSLGSNIHICKVQLKIAGHNLKTRYNCEC